MEMIPMLLSAGGAAAGAGAAGAAGAGASALSALSMGTSAISALSTFAAGQSQKRQDDLDAQSEQMAGTGELLNAQQKSNEISANYNQTVADQLAVSSAGGYDVSSGSVVAARSFAQSQAQRGLTTAFQNGQMLAAVRRARMFGLQAQGDQAATAGLVGAISKLAGSSLNFASLGGSGGGGVLPSGDTSGLTPGA